MYYTLLIEVDVSGDICSMERIQKISQKDLDELLIFLNQIDKKKSFGLEDYSLEYYLLEGNESIPKPGWFEDIVPSDHGFSTITSISYTPFVESVEIYKETLY